MPDVTVVTGEDDYPTGISGVLQERAQWTDSVDGPVITDLPGTSEAVVDGVDDDPDNSMI
jgi:hypothetical protein